MCPLCLSNVAIAVAGVISAGGVAAVAVKNLAPWGAKPANRQ
jgi:hypothetical protein